MEESRRGKQGGTGMDVPGWSLAGAVFPIIAAAASAQTPPAERTAALPDSWLVLYNSNVTDSVAWKNWYIAQWGIPETNTLGLNVSGDEKVSVTHFQTQIFDPVVNHLDAHPELSERVMGILVGYRVPGNFFEDAQRPNLQGGGGWSVACNLQDLTSSTWYRRANLHYFAVVAVPPAPRLTKSTLSFRLYMTARIDAPTLEQAKDLTRRARTISTNALPLPVGEYICHDYSDAGAPGGDVWYLLRAAVQCEGLNAPAGRFPWLAWESECDPTPSCAMQFSYYRLTGWQNVAWGGAPAGPRILGYALNSWGATTVRSTTAHEGRYVPNALFNGGFAAAIGATAEPYLTSQVDVSSLVWCLADGRTLGEAMFHATPYHNWMWELDGDPLLRVPAWFGDPPPNELPAAPGSLGSDEYVSGRIGDVATPQLLFVQSDPNLGDWLSYHIQIDDDVDFASPVVDYVSVSQPQGTAQYTVGQLAAGGTYLVGEPGLSLAPGAYNWRVRSSDGVADSDWAVANAGAVAFIVAVPAGVVIGETNGQTEVSEDGRTDFFTVALQAVPTAAAQVGILITPSDQLDLGNGGGTDLVLIFTPENWSLPQSVGVRAVHDAECRDDQWEAITFAVLSSDPAYANLSLADLIVHVIDDDDCDEQINGGGGPGLPSGEPPDPHNGEQTNLPDGGGDGGGFPDALAPPMGGLGGGCGLGSLSGIALATTLRLLTPRSKPRRS